MNKIILSNFLILLLLSGCGQINQSQPVVESQPNLIYENKNVEQSTETYLVRANYPQFSLPDQDQADKVNAAIKTKVDILINNFIEIADFDEPIIDTPDLGSQMDIAYEIYTASPQIISLAFNYYSYISGAAHGFNGYGSFNYDLLKDQEIGLVDLFLPDTNYLEALSLMATDYFDQKFEAGNWFAEGVEPESGNFTNFVLTQESIIFLFENYQVVAYVMGPQEWELRYQDLGALFNQNGPVAYFNK